jgi:hypothetical protein
VDICSLQLLLPGESISSFPMTELSEQLFFFWKTMNLEWLDCSKADISEESVGFVDGKGGLTLNSRIFAVETLDSLLFTESISVEGEDALVRLISETRSGLFGIC